MTYVTPLFMRLLRLLTVALLISFMSGIASAQTQSAFADPQSTTPQSTTPQTGAQTPAKPQTPEAGGPQGDTGSIALPKKKAEEPPKEEKPPKVKNPEGLEDFSLRVNVPIV